MRWTKEQDYDYAPIPAGEIGEFVDGDLSLDLIRFEPINPDLKRVAAYVFDMIDRSSGLTAGRIQLRLGVTEELYLHGGQIGFRVDEPFRGKRFAARSVRMLLPLAARVGMDEVWITCDPTNLASRKSIEIAGGLLIETRPIPSTSKMFAEGHRSVCRFRFDLSGY